MPNLAHLARDVATKSWRWLAHRHDDPITWAVLRTQLAQTTLPLPRTNGGRVAVVGGVGVLLLLALLWYASGQRDDKGLVTYPHASLINPILGGLGALFLIYAAIRQARTAADRHAAQTEADRERRITESFSKAIEQLASDRLEVRLGGIYALERISQESPRDYWTVMENLTAFVRERTQRTEGEKPLELRISERAYLLWETAGRPEGRGQEFWREAETQEWREPPPADIAAVLTVIQRRSDGDRTREVRDRRTFDFQQAVLRNADLLEAHLEGANLIRARLEGAIFTGAHLAGANLSGAYLAGANLSGEAQLEGTNFSGAHLEGAALPLANLKGANLRGAYLAGAELFGAYFERADLREAYLARLKLSRVWLRGADLADAHFEGADLSSAELNEWEIVRAFGDAETKLPKGLTRPAGWPAPAKPLVPDLP